MYPGCARDGALELCLLAEPGLEVAVDLPLANERPVAAFPQLLALCAAGVRIGGLDSLKKNKMLDKSVFHYGYGKHTVWLCLGSDGIIGTGGALGDGCIVGDAFTIAGPGTGSIV